MRYITEEIQLRSLKHEEGMFFLLGAMHIRAWIQEYTEKQEGEFNETLMLADLEEYLSK